MKASIPQDRDAEEILIGATLVWPAQALEVGSDLAPEDFYVPAHQALWAAFLTLWETEGIKPDAVNMLAEGQKQGFSGSGADLLGLMGSSITPTPYHAKRVTETKAARDLMRYFQAGLDALTHNADPYEVGDDILNEMAGLGSHSTEPQAQTLGEIMDEPTSYAPWVIPGLIKLDWKIMVVAAEGVGKAVLLRSMCMGAAQGVHPLTHRKQAPQRCLYVDLENPREAILEPAVSLDSTLMKRLGDTYDETRFRIWRKPGGINLRARRDRSDFQREIAAQKPTLVVIGPLYKAYRKKGREDYDETALEVINILDDLRVKYGFALMLEHHAAKGHGDNRSLDPKGSGLWMATPEIGVTLTPHEMDENTNVVGYFRKPRLKHEWPTTIRRDPDYLIKGVWSGVTTF